MARRRSGQQRDDFGRFIRPGTSYDPLERDDRGRFRRGGEASRPPAGATAGEQGAGTGRARGNVERVDYGAGKPSTGKRRRTAPSSSTAGTAGDTAPARRRRQPSRAAAGDGGQGGGGGAAGGAETRGQRRPPRVLEAFTGGLLGRGFWREDA